MLPSNRKKPVNSNQLTGFYMRATLATNGLKQTKGIYTGGKCIFEVNNKKLGLGLNVFKVYKKNQIVLTLLRPIFLSYSF